MTKVLILTVDCWNKNIAASSASTYSALFSAMDDLELSNIYIREELPNDPCCKRYFQISERQIIKSLLHRNVRTGREIALDKPCTEDEQSSIDQQKELYSKQRRRFYYTKKMIREFMWKLSPWKSKELDSFLTEVKPDIILYAMEGYIHFNRLCRYVTKKTKAKSIGYFWDDNFTYKQRPGNIGYKLFRFFQRKSLKKLAKKTDAFWAISPKTKQEADDFFGIRCEIISKPTERELTEPTFATPNTPLKMFYAGNLAIGRMDSIRMVAEVLREINANTQKILLDVYSPTEIPEELQNFGHSVRFHKPIPLAEVLKLQSQTDILLFVEDVVGKQRKVARLSFSTKIPDYLSSGKCILAIGDFDTAPMDYLLHEETALCAQTREEVLHHLTTILNDTSLLDSYGQRAFDCACKNHAAQKIQQKTRETMKNLLDE